MGVPGLRRDWKRLPLQILLFAGVSAMVIVQRRKRAGDNSRE